MDRRLPFSLIGAVAGMVAGALTGTAFGTIVLAFTFGALGYLVGKPTVIVAPGLALPSSRSIPVRPDEAEAVLAEALGVGAIDGPAYDRLVGLLAARRARTVEAPAATWLAPDAPPGAADPFAATSSRRAPIANVVARPTGPSSFERRLRALRDLIASDLAVHGLTYLGVLLLFVAAFGFVLFSFGSVQLGLRPVAEVAAPAVLLGSARFLRRRGAPFVATALGLLGGVLLPIFLFASLVDGVAVPPDPRGAALVFGLVAISLGAAVGYGWYARRVPDASVRFLVVPSLWLAVWAGGLLTAPLPDGGYSLRRWSATQLASVAIAVALTAVAIRLRPDGRFAAATRRTIVPGIAVAYLLTVVLSAGEGWPAAPLVVAGLATLVTSEAIGGPGRVIAAIQPLLLAAAVVPLGPAFGPEVAGVVGAIAFLALFEGLARRRPSIEGAVEASAGAAISLVVAAPDPWPSVVALAVASVWAHVRRVWPPSIPAAAEVLAFVAAVLPVGLAIGLVRALDDGVAIAILGIAIATAAVVARLWRSRDAYLGWWVAAAATTVSAAAAVATVGPAAAAAAAAAAAIALFVAPAPAWVRGWGGPASLAWAVLAATEALHLGVGSRSLGLAAVGCVAAMLAGTHRRTTVAAHAGGAGAAIAAIALAFPTHGWTRAALVAAWTIAAVAIVAWGERGDRGPIGLLAAGLVRRRRSRLAAMVKVPPVVAAAVGFAVFAVDLAEASGVTEGRRSWNGVVMAVVGVIGAVVARAMLHRHHRTSSGVLVAPTAAVAAFFFTVVGIAVSAPDPWPTIEALIAPAAATLVLGGELRRPAMTWTAWVASAALAVLLSERAGVEPRDLWIASFAWGAVLLTAGLALDDLRGRRAAGETVRTPWLRPPIALAALALPASLAFAFRGSEAWYGTWSLVAAAIYLAVAIQLRAGSIAAVPAALATVGYAAHLPSSPIDRPWLFAPWTAALVLIALVVAGRRRSDDPWLRWDLGLLVTAHGVAATALALAIATDAVVPTWSAFGALSLAYAVVRRRVEWAAAGAIVLLVAAANAGPGWLSLTLAASAVGAGVAAAIATGATRWILQALAAVSAAGAWGHFLEWRAWPTPRAVVTTTVLGAALLILPALAYRARRLATDWTLTCWGVGVVAAVGATIAATEAAHHVMSPASPGAGLSSRAAGLVAAVALGSIAFALGTSAARLRAPWQREVSAVVALLAAARVGSAIGTSIVAGAAVAAALGLVAVLVWIALWRARPTSPWLGSIGIVAIAADAAALALSLQALPRRDVLEASLVLTGVECAVAGIALRRPHLVTPSPIFIAAAWLVFAADAFRGQVQWFTIPCGIALLAVVSIERRARRLLGRNEVTTELLVAEYVGMTLVVAAALIETIAIDAVRGVVAIGAGSALAGWGALSRVRRRAWFGAAAVVVAAVLMLAGPLARLVPDVRGPALWGLLAASGLVLIVAATMLERGRERLAAFVRRLDALMEGWE
jgi:hypothetical protein